ncbi:MAG: sulfatase [Candidatus Aminicenantes bacterium]|nr:sulfatase [Candidatus Aminicenantes bacterium]
MKRRRFVEVLGKGAAGCAFLRSFSSFFPPASIWAEEGSLPNVILFNVDDLGWTDLSCYGSRYYETPNIDRLAAQGTWFTDAYASCAVCSPSRASLMTGRYPARIGITDWIHHLDREAYTALGTGLPPSEYVGDSSRRLLCPPNPYWMELDELTIAEHLKTAGYTTCHIGKWHLGFRPWFPDRQGFDINIGGCEIGQPPTYFDPYYQNERRSSIPTLKPRRPGEHLTEREAEEAEKFILDHTEQPFFLNMWFYAVHTPIEGPEELVAKYRRKKPANQKCPEYAALVESVDRAVGRIVAALERTGKRHSTLIIFTSDNGGLKREYATDNAPLRSGKGYPYEGGIRVPLIISWPGKIKGGAECREPVTSVDIFPTLCSACGLEYPVERTIDGENLWPLLHGRTLLKRVSIFWHFPHYREPDIVPYSIIRKGKWKLIKRYEGKQYELFNLEEDLEEKVDLAGSKPEKVRELERELSAWLKETQARMPKENPGYSPKH